MKEQVVDELCDTCSVYWQNGDLFFDTNGKADSFVRRNVGAEFRMTIQAVRKVPTPAEDWLEFSSRFGGDGKPPARMLKLVKTWEKMHRRYFGHWITLSGRLLESDSADANDREHLKAMLTKRFGECEYEPWMLADRIVRDEEE